ncbi:cyclin-domain-containing protein [Fistulina hepatica ATCC 64428]|uniref:Cyclin-domain-containing protein n=1 Tax=Fistulina hepatica ATCC 64428 TaxID=1128425 RepID=A0A0D7A136_9AGAR|nr:cyclin-domain-containing protein [Fistulina hepatica ATCC 64428]
MEAGSTRVEIPRAFEDAGKDDLVVLIADMLQRLMDHNDQVPLAPENLSRFHSRTPPNISILSYLKRVVQYTTVEKSCLLIVMHYTDQFCARNPWFSVTSLSCHRFVIASITVATKFFCDIQSTNKRLARVGGIPVHELNHLEWKLLLGLDWKLTCTREILQEYYVNLVRSCGSRQYVLAPAPTVAPLIEDTDVFMASRPASPVARHVPPTEVSAILVDPSVAQFQPAYATIEQNVAFAELQQHRQAAA